MSANRADELLECSFPTANNIVAQLEKKGILQEVTGQKRSRRYRFLPYLRLFEGQALPIASHLYPAVAYRCR